MTILTFTGDMTLYKADKEWIEAFIQYIESRRYPNTLAFTVDDDLKTFGEMMIRYCSLVREGKVPADRPPGTQPGAPPVGSTDVKNRQDQPALGQASPRGLALDGISRSSRRDLRSALYGIPGRFQQVARLFPNLGL